MNRQTDSTFISSTSYRGYIIQQKADGYYVGGLHRGDTIEQAREAIDGIFQEFIDSMRRPVKTTHSFTKEATSYAHQ